MNTQFFMRPMRQPPALDPDEGNRAALRMVNNLAHAQGIPIIYEAEQRGPSHKPLWVVTPTIMGEKHNGFEGCGKTRKEAENTCALAIWRSGHLLRVCIQPVWTVC
ncbi:hypothetical protein BN14_09507 [Rhizoctonia solani AG-1 IB]|uniref:DRBM domain-containing protein n=2 Tax=Rhizoctonia solani TaxID=456999 RepID=A0A8H3GGB9_9AGAM|nr:unnamed protein product [Rhizoctonia solani]CCO35389.1 hypothetical protein BN14_09507 [Rhizoctonia solani AG-1 IB]